MNVLHRPYGFNYHGMVMRKWDLAGQTLMSEKRPDKDWHQVPLSMWDYSGCEIVEFEPVKEVK